MAMRSHYQEVQKEMPAFLHRIPSFLLRGRYTPKIPLRSVLRLFPIKTLKYLVKNDCVTEWSLDTLRRSKELEIPFCSTCPITL